ncbi:PD-(D/E)XK nuclease family protein [Sinomonas sp. JGH33]|uniref:DNA 3'-5' helicase n=1 Tax=Sinomonas terricola TaxID=3110330 RepID=A0ABU5T0G1_9MICC|nr:PD-(D/E)XK nuclease family protein [Sinomonas sp. JGH33]MEA5453148.1 PD-(D/E)XK nuclease family protein [Sinomonas sp. JGH33]
MTVSAPTLRHREPERPERSRDGSRPDARSHEPGLRLLPPAPRAARSGVSLSPDQRAVVDLRQGVGPVLVWGAPGTGKSTVLVEAAAMRVERDDVDPSQVLLVAPSRAASARLRDGFTARLDRSLSSPPARTWQSYAFDLIRRARAEGRLEWLPRAPRLLSGAEQDLIIRELLAGHALTGRGPAWPRGLESALGTRGFRHEVRELFDRVTEYGTTARELAELGRRTQRPEWEAAAELFREYRDVLELRMPEAFDPAGIITTARQILLDDADLLAAERRRLGLLVVDDVQEANPAVLELLSVLGEGQDVIVSAAPDVVVQGFRGARPELVSRVGELLGGLTELPLSTSHRMPPAVAAAWQAVASRISAVPGGQAARQLEHAELVDPLSEVESHVLHSPMHELRYLAHRIQDAHLLGGLGYGEIAIMVRSGVKLAQAQRFLASQGIPVKVPVAETAVRDEAAVRPLLAAYRAVVDPSSLTAEAVVELLTSRIGGASALELRRLRQSLRQLELSSGGGRASDALLLEAVGAPAMLDELGVEAQAARRVARMLDRGREAVAQAGATAETVLWALWDAAGLSQRWYSLAMGGGPVGLRADRDLDALMALFHTAERYVDRLPGASPAQFLDYLLDQEIPMDTLAPRAQADDAVELLTPASAAGREWRLVFVMGLQDGTWPNNRLRGELLGSTMFTDCLELGPVDAMLVTPRSRLRDIRYDELRMFSAVVSRATERLVCTGVRSEDEVPSPFLDLVDALPEGKAVRPYTEVPRMLGLRSLVAELRQAVEEGGQDAVDAASLLARLAEAKAPGAHPADWYGLAPLTSTGPVVPEGRAVFVSPSKVETAAKSPLDWFVSAAGGEPATDFARSLGTLVHAIAQDLPRGTAAEFHAELERRWPSLGHPDSWEGRREYERAGAMLVKLAEYVRGAARELVGVELDFEAALDGVGSADISQRTVIRGQVDRLERDDEGRLVVVDLKTGKSKPRAADVPRHAQLAAYQVAVAAGAFEDDGVEQRTGGSRPGGAELVQLGDTAKSVAIQQQPPLDGAEWAIELVERAAEAMSAAEFVARHEPGSGFAGGCRLPDICPLCSRGRQVTE